MRNLMFALALASLTGLLHLQAVDAGIWCNWCDTYITGGQNYDPNCGDPEYQGLAGHIVYIDTPSSSCVTLINTYYVDLYNHTDPHVTRGGSRYSSDNNHFEGECVTIDQYETHCYCNKGDFCNSGGCEHCFTN